MACLIDPRNRVTPVFPAEAETGFSLPELHAMLECDCIDVFSLTHGRRAVVDDEGYRKELPVNLIASLLYWEAGGDPAHYILGKVLVGDEREIQ